MAKVQKSFFLHEDLDKLVQLIEERSGASFTRTVTAALIRYIFDGANDPQPAAMFGPDPVWMQIAVALERGRLAVDDIPDEMHNLAIKSVEELLKCQPSGTDDVYLEDLRSRLSARRQGKAEFQSKVESLGGKREAIVDILKWRYAK